MERLSITLLADDYPSKGRPVFVFVQQLVEELVNQGVDVSVVAPQSLVRSLIRRIAILPTKMTYTTKCGKGYQVYRPYSLSFGNGHKLLYKFAHKFNQWQINKVLERIKPSVLYGHFWHSAYKLSSYATKYHLPLFVACGEGDNALEDLVQSLSEKEKNELTSAVNGVISVSSENKRKCVDYELAVNDDILVLPNSVDTGIFVKNDKRDVRGELGVTNDDFVIAFTGAFIHRKGSLRLSQAITKLNDPYIKSIFIGARLDSDGDTPTCDGIVWKGRVEHDEVPQYLYAADCFCLPTLNEGCSNAIVEALAAGLPVISSNLPFNEDILNDGNSIKVDPMDVDQIANAIKLLKDNKELRKQLSEGALKMASDLRIDKRAASIIRFIETRLK